MTSLAAGSRLAGVRPVCWYVDGSYLLTTFVVKLVGTVQHVAKSRCIVHVRNDECHSICYKTESPMNGASLAQSLRINVRVRIAMINNQRCYAVRAESTHNYHVYKVQYPH